MDSPRDENSSGTLIGRRLPATLRMRSRRARAALTGRMCQAREPVNTKRLPSGSVTATVTAAARADGVFGDEFLPLSRSTVA